MQVDIFSWADWRCQPPLGYSSTILRFSITLYYQCYHSRPLANQAGKYLSLLHCLTVLMKKSSNFHLSVVLSVLTVLSVLRVYLRPERLPWSVLWLTDVQATLSVRLASSGTTIWGILAEKRREALKHLIIIPLINCPDLTIFKSSNLISRKVFKSPPHSPLLTLYGVICAYF